MLFQKFEFLTQVHFFEPSPLSVRPKSNVETKSSRSLDQRFGKQAAIFKELTRTKDKIVLYERMIEILNREGKLDQVREKTATLRQLQIQAALLEEKLNSTNINDQEAAIFDLSNPDLNTAITDFSRAEKNNPNSGYAEKEVEIKGEKFLVLIAHGGVDEQNSLQFNVPENKKQEFDEQNKVPSTKSTKDSFTELSKPEIKIPTGDVSQWIKEKEERNKNTVPSKGYIEYLYAKHKAKIILISCHSGALPKLETDADVRTINVKTKQTLNVDSSNKYAIVEGAK